MKGGEAVEQEQKWIRAIQRRNSRAAAEQLIQAYYDEIYRFVYRQTGSREDAMDLTQSIFIAVLRALPGYRAERASFRTWMYRIVVNESLQLLKAREREVLSGEDQPEASYQEPGFEAPEEDLMAQLDRLEWTEQEVIRLRYFEELSLKEIAEILTMNLNTVKAKLYRGLKKLKVQMQEGDCI